MSDIKINKDNNARLIGEIDRNIAVIDEALAWAREYNKDSFPKELFKEYRRDLRKKRAALEEQTSAAAYGESQVGKSYVMSSLLSTEEMPFVIRNNGKEYSFIYDLNDSGGNTNQVESTGLITRFTIQPDPERPEGMVRITNLSVVDIILILLDSYYNDVRHKPDSILSTAQINNELDSLQVLRTKGTPNGILDEDDIKNIFDYIRDLVENSVTLYKSNFVKVVGPAIAYVPVDSWIDVFSIMWNHNEDINRLFTTLINAYKRLDFKRVVYVPFETILRKNGTLLKIDWLDAVCGTPVNANSENYKQTTDVYDRNGNLIAADFPKSDLSALTAEITLEVPEELAESRSFLRNMDLMDFPGSRSRQNYEEADIKKVLPQMLRRGKVAYLFNKYSRALQIGSVLFCHHNNQMTETTLSQTITHWLEDNNNIGKTPADREKMIRHTGGVSPLFFIATKFNTDLQYTRNDDPADPSTLDKHWSRFDTIIPELIKPNSWLERWSVTTDGRTVPFRSIYPLRDFYYSKRNNLFEGFSDGETKSGETKRIDPTEFPNYFDKLKESFLANDFVKRHFENPEKSWEEVATVNNDGSKPIIRDLNKLAPVLDEARRKKFVEELDKVRESVANALSVYYEPEDTEEKNRKVRRIAGDIRMALDMLVASRPGEFGRLIDTLMVKSEALRNIAYDIIICHLDAPRDFSDINFIRAQVGINIKDSRENNIQKLLRYFGCDSEEELRDRLKDGGYRTLEEIITEPAYTLSSVGDVVTWHFINYWIDHLNEAAQTLAKSLPHSEEIVHMLINLFEKLDVRSVMTAKIKRYTETFDEKEQPNAIGDYAALVFNNFVSTVGRNYLSDSIAEELRDKASRCDITVDFSPSGWDRKPRRQDLKSTLRVFDEASSMINQPQVDIEVLRQLPFWNNYIKWENLLIVGLIYSSDVSNIDPVSNEKVRKMMETTQSLYSEFK